MHDTGPTHVTSLRLPEQVFRELRDVARKEDRTVSAFVRRAVIRALEDERIRG